MSDQTIEQRLEEIIKPLSKGWTSWAHDQLDGTSFAEAELKEIADTERFIKLSLMHLINEARIDELNKKLPKVLDYTMTPEQTSMIVNRLDELELQLTSKENKE